MLIRRRWWSPMWLTLLVVAVMAVRALLNQRGDWSGVIAAVALVVIVPTAFLLTRLIFGRHLRRWAARGGWTKVDPGERRWPWQPHPHGRSRVKRAWQREVNGLPVTFGELRWRGDAFPGLVKQGRADGAFVVVRLPQPEPPMALHHAFTPVGDSPRLEQPALLEAYLDGAIETWTVRGDELYTVEARDAWIDPDLADQAVRRALRVVQVLDLGPDTTSTVPPD